jgi:hypothetical protein
VPTSHSESIGFNLDTVVYQIDYLNENARVSNNYPSRFEMEVIASGITIAKHASEAISIEKAWQESGSQVEADDQCLPLSCFRLDPTIETVDTSAMYSQRSITVQGNTTWKNVSYSLRNIRTGLRYLLLESITYTSWLIRHELEQAGYYKVYNLVELLAEIKLRKIHYPNQPIYVFLDRHTEVYLKSVWPDCFAAWRRERIYTFSRSYHHSISSGLTHAGVVELVKQVSGRSESNGINIHSVESAGSAVVAANQVRFNGYFQDDRRVEAHALDPTKWVLRYDLRQGLGIRVEPINSIEDPAKSWTKYEQEAVTTRLDLIEE